jgi:hypothetical protein
MPGRTQRAGLAVMRQIYEHAIYTRLIETVASEDHMRLIIDCHPQGGQASTDGLGGAMALVLEHESKRSLAVSGIFAQHQR